jgi:Tfp pilus assembly protein PilZ
MTRKAGLKKKPLPYIILLIIFFLEPLIKILYLKFTSGFGIPLLFRTLISYENQLEVAKYFLLMPMAGLMFVKVRKFSYFLVLAILGFYLYEIITFRPYTWPYFVAKPLILAWIFSAIACGSLFFLFIPSVRKPFFDRTIRWWESHQRFMVDFLCSLQKKDEDKKFDGHILNVSLSGAFIKTSQTFDIGEVLTVEFEPVGTSKKINAKVVGIFKFNGNEGIGVQFTGGIIQRIKNLGLVWSLKKAGFGPVQGRA